MADLIDRQKIVDMFQRMAYDDWNQGVITTWANAFSEAADMIEDLPSVEAEPVRHGRWIPVSEQLPEDGQEVLFSTKTGRVHLGRYHNDNSVNQWYSSLDKMRAWNNVVNAWMPLPEPYEERYED